jgi:hypothetical protein
MSLCPFSFDYEGQELIERYDARKQREQEAREKRKEERNEYANQLKQLKTPALEEQLRQAGLKHKIPKKGEHNRTGKMRNRLVQHKFDKHKL